ncbi:MAG: hypothetical protein A2156_10820 [Deltaproteobacteria bacterium RBG_16_48_10]|nr:MAG: hypothetical protein A2156_10820 [Deltaproteobacteria bacterium RBG_16_48_10]
MELPIEISKLHIPDKIINKWQSIVNTLAEMIHVPAALIMRVVPPHIEVFRSSETNNNPYKAGDKEHLAGLYCERVMRTRNELLVPNALKDENWNKNPDIKLGMISYLGFPILWPTGEIFGTICVVDSKENRYGEVYKKLLFQSKELVDAHLDLIYQNMRLENTVRELEKSLNEIKVLRGFLSICSYCKKIRDDKGHWSNIETYIRDRSEVEFSHGICPECSIKVYSDLENRRK